MTGCPDGEEVHADGHEYFRLAVSRQAAYAPAPGKTSASPARFIVGAGLLLLDFLLPWSRELSVTGIATAAIIGWFGVTHVLAALIAYPGCPELGAVPSLLLGRVVKIGCGPWRWLDARLRLSAE